MLPMCYAHVHYAHREYAHTHSSCKSIRVLAYCSHERSSCNDNVTYAMVYIYMTPVNRVDLLRNRRWSMMCWCAPHTRSRRCKMPACWYLRNDCVRRSVEPESGTLSAHILHYINLANCIRQIYACQPPHV